MVSPWQLLPDLTPEEFASLKADIREHGLRVPVVVDAASGEIVDGHHRQRAVEELRAEGVRVNDYREVRAFADDEDRLAFVIGANLFRRHLGRTQRAELVAKLRERGWSLRRIGEAVGASVGTVHAELAGVQDRTPELVEGADGKTYRARRPASRPAVVVTSRRAEDRAREALAILGDDAPGRLLSLPNAEKLARKVAWERRWADAEPVQGTAGERWELRCGDFEDVLAELEPESVDMVLTDPPYTTEFAGEWGRLGEACARVMKPGAVAVFYQGDMFLPEALSQLGQHLSWAWHVALVQDAREARVHGRQVHNGHRDLLVLSKGAYVPRRWLRDTIKTPLSDAADKLHHPWQQAAAAPRYLVDILCPDGGLVLDPCCGSATFGVAALSSQRRPRFVGVELDPAVVAIAAERLAQVGNEEGAS